jgi:ABC-type glutathione transport system ATPase component
VGALLEWRNLEIRLPGKEAAPPIVSGLNLQLQRGECVALTGPSGCGKTTACLAPFGLLHQPMEMSGIARFAGYPAASGSAQTGSNRVAFVLQEPANNFAPHLNIISQITDLNNNISYSRALNWCVELGIDNAQRLLRRYPNQCSGGELQRLALVAALVQEPTLLVADEPTAALDAASRDAWCRLVRRCCERGLAVLLVTHDPVVLAAVADRQVPVGAAPTLDAEPPPDAMEGALAGPDALLAVHLERAVGAGAPALAEGGGLRLDAGQTLCVTGPSGAGKSSLLRLVLGLPSPWRGEVVWRGQLLRAWPHASRERIAGVMGAVLQDARGCLTPRRAILDTVSASFRRSGQPWRVSRQRAAEELAVLGVPADCWQRTPAELSVGQAQRVALAQALATALASALGPMVGPAPTQKLSGEPVLLVLDEPTSAQDRGHRHLVIDRLRRAQLQHGAALLVATHDPDLMSALGGQRVPLLSAGTPAKA